MRTGNQLWTVALIGLLSLSGCATAPLTGALQPDGRRIVLLLDSSTSMRRTDPEGVGPQGAQLVLGLVGSGDNVGVVTYAKDANVQRPLRAAGTSRGGLAAKLKGVNRNGITDFGRGLALAADMLAAGRAPEGSTVILLTDGVPYRGRRRTSGQALKPLLERFRTQGWRIFALALGDEAATPFLTQIVASTEGAVFPVANAKALAPAFVDVATEALGYLRGEAGARDVELVPHTGRLAFLHRGASSGVVQGPTETGLPSVIQTAAGPFQVALVEDPAAGPWSFQAEGASEVVALIEPSFGIEFAEGSPPDQLGTREEGRIVVRLKGSSEGLAKVRGRVTLRARLSVGDGAEFGRPIPLRRAGEVFEATFRAPTVMEQTSLTVAVEAVLAEGGKTFVLKRTRSLTVLPGEGKRAPRPLELTFDPTRLSAEAWSEDPTPRASVTLRGDPERAVSVRSPSGAFELPPNASRALSLPVDGSRVELTASSEDGATWRGAVETELRRYRLRGPTSVELPKVAAGAPGGTSAPFALEVSSGDLQLELPSLRGPAGASLEVTLADGRLACAPSRDMPPGDYAGAVVARISSSTLGARRIPVRFSLQPAVQALTPVRLHGRWGWVTTAVEVAWPRGGEVAVAFEPGPLEGPAVIRPAFDLRVRPLDGWDGERLGPKTRRVALSVFLSSDLPEGDYRGRLVIRSQAARDERLEIPVTLTLAR